MRDKNSDDTGLTATEISKFKTLLFIKRNEILGDVRLDNDEMLMGNEIRLVREIDEALSRIENGTYGICEGSDKLISMARLEAIPWAKYCVEYAGMLEKNLVKKTSQSPDREYDYGDDEQDDDSRYAFRRTAI